MTDQDVIRPHSTFIDWSTPSYPENLFSLKGNLEQMTDSASPQESYSALKDLSLDILDFGNIPDLDSSRQSIITDVLDLESNSTSGAASINESDNGSAIDVSQNGKKPMAVRNKNGSPTGNQKKSRAVVSGMKSSKKRSAVQNQQSRKATTWTKKLTACHRCTKQKMKVCTNVSHATRLLIPDYIVFSECRRPKWIMLDVSYY